MKEFFMAKEKKQSFEDDFNAFSEKCAEKKLRLTPLRAGVWECLHKTKKPAGAYDIVKMLENAGVDAPPVSVYRVLDFLVENGFAHRLPASGTYLLCRREGQCAAPAFLFCLQCRTVEEVPAGKLFKEIKKSAGKFKIKSAAVVVEGICQKCRK